MEIIYEVIDVGYAAFLDGAPRVKIGELHRDQRGWGWQVKVDGMPDVFRSNLLQAQNALIQRATNSI